MTCLYKYIVLMSNTVYCDYCLVFLGSHVTCIAVTSPEVVYLKTPTWSVGSLPKEQQKRALDVPFLIFTCVDRYTADQRRAALERVCLSMLRVADTSALVDFFCDHINEVMNLIHTQQPRSEVHRDVTMTLCLNNINKIH